MTSGIGWREAVDRDLGIAFYFRGWHYFSSVKEATEAQEAMGASVQLYDTVSGHVHATARL